MTSLNFELYSSPDKTATCNETMFRYHAAAFLGKNGRICVTKELRPLKRKSCPNSESCGPKTDGIQESVANSGLAAIEFEPGLANGNEVAVGMVPQRFDRESGQLEEWPFVIRKTQSAKDNS